MLSSGGCPFLRLAATFASACRRRLNTEHLPPVEN
jgi:hypothetical protein